MEDRRSTESGILEIYAGATVASFVALSILTGSVLLALFICAN